MQTLCPQKSSMYFELSPSSITFWEKNVKFFLRKPKRLPQEEFRTWWWYLTTCMISTSRCDYRIFIFMHSLSLLCTLVSRWSNYFLFIFFLWKSSLSPLLVLFCFRYHYNGPLSVVDSSKKKKYLMRIHKFF